MTSDLQNKTILVTGASSGIGEAIAERLIIAGAKVVGLSRQEGRLAEENGFFHESVDFSDLKTLPKRLQQINKSFSINAIVSCAGRGQFGSIEEFSFEQIRTMVDLNLTSHIYLAKQFMPTLRKQPYSDFILIGSEAALSGGRKGAVYSASKSGLRGLSQALRDECAKSGVRVSLINPGMVKTPFFNDLNFSPGKEEVNYIEPQDVAETVMMILRSRPGTVFDEINLSPLKRVIDFQNKP